MTDPENPLPIVPCGAWPSPVDAAAIAAGAVAIGEPRVHEGVVYWLESRPAEGGRNSLLRCRPGAAREELTPAPLDVRSRVHEYGGGSYLPTPAGVVLVDFTSGDLILLEDSATRTLYPGQPGVRFADFCFDARQRRLIMVSERHGEDAEPANALEWLSLDDPGAGPAALHRGRDFYASPRIGPDGRLAFVTWDHPNMPWDGSELRLLDFDATGAVTGETLLAGGAAESVVAPTWLADGALVFASDQTGYWNLYRFDQSGVYCLLDEPCEYAGPLWMLGQSTVAPVGPHHVVAVRRDRQHQELVIIDPRGMTTPVDGPWVGYAGLVGDGNAVVFVGSHADRPAELVRLPLDGSGPELLASAILPTLPAEWIAVPEALEFPTRDGTPAFAYLYPPANPQVRRDPNERPPLVVMTHGGPTSSTSPALRPAIQYFTSRGFAVVDVDYRGSSGYGRAYRDALRGRWGILEVEDCEDAVRYLASRGLADPTRVVIRGGSAGGFTTLSALTRSHVFAAGASHYGIGDLSALARETHKFESRYLDGLVGDAEALEARSPIHHVDRLSCPVIFFQGAEDRVVPPQQARDMVAALDAKHLPVAYLEFAGEGHGFRRADNVRRALECEYAFYCRVLGIEPAAPLPRLEIRNL